MKRIKLYLAIFLFVSYGISAEYREGLKNWEFDKEAAQIFASGASGIAHEQETSEDQKFAAKLTSAKPNFSVTSGIEEIDLNRHEISLYSKNGEDGILAKIVQAIGPIPHYCVDIGASDGRDGSNTYLLRLQGWQGLLLDRRFENPILNLHQEYISAENINSLLSKYEVPLEFGLLSIGIDYNDFYIWKALKGEYRPALVLIQYNGKHSPFEDKIVKYRPFFIGDTTDYFGASLLALFNLGRAKGYSLVYADKSGTHLFFVRDDLIRERVRKGEPGFKEMNDPIKLHRNVSHTDRTPDPKNRPYISSSDL